jgi:predicted unusual protein kinase regulating ubiquinone biosynthesis (AarF/ABC1/UbiB family)
MLLEDGRMAFLDFGLFKRMPAGAVELEMEVARAIIEGDIETIMRLGTETGFFPDPERFRPERVMEQFRAATSWYTEDEYVELTPEYATQVLIDMSDPRSQYFGQLRHEKAPPDHIFGRRMEVLTLAVLSQLRARNNFHRISREWFYTDEPVTDLGRQEAEFYSRGRSRAAS